MKCDKSLLWTLVEQGKDPGDEADVVVRHLESCSSCRDTLAEMGAQQTWWDDARHWLSIDEVVDDSPESLAHPLPPIDLSFLEEPSHPEMLGRIGRYDVEALLGRGGMGVVLRAHDSDLQRTVAVKVMAPEWAASASARQRFAREAQAAASVAHDNVIPIYNVEATAKLPYLVMRYVPGMTLQRWVHINGAPEPATILRVAGQLAEGLAAAHRRGLVHRDIKPANVLVGQNIQRVWITDFGLARAADATLLTRTGVIAGTPHYMSPEQARGESVDHRSDLFSLGCVLYFLCTGRPPFDAENTLAILHKIVSEHPRPLMELRRDLPPSLVTLVHRLLQRNPDRRPQDCQEVISQLADAQVEQKKGRVARFSRNPRIRKRLQVAAMSVVVGAVVLAAAVTWWPDSDSADAAVHHETTPPSQTAQAPAMTVPVPLGPYDFRITEMIARADAIDRQRFRERAGDIQRQLDRLEQPDDAFVGPRWTAIQPDHWDRELAELKQWIQAAEAPVELTHQRMFNPSFLEGEKR